MWKTDFRRMKTENFKGRYIKKSKLFLNVTNTAVIIFLQYLRYENYSASFL